MGKKRGGEKKEQGMGRKRGMEKYKSKRQGEMRHSCEMLSSGHHVAPALRNLGQVQVSVCRRASQQCQAASQEAAVLGLSGRHSKTKAKAKQREWEARGNILEVLAGSERGEKRVPMIKMHCLCVNKNPLTNKVIWALAQLEFLSHSHCQLSCGFSAGIFRWCSLFTCFLFLIPFLFVYLYIIVWRCVHAYARCVWGWAHMCTCAHPCFDSRACIIQVEAREHLAGLSSCLLHLRDWAQVGLAVGTYTC